MGTRKRRKRLKKKRRKKAAIFGSVFSRDMHVKRSSG
jgi:hypothetical protein